MRTPQVLATCDDESRDRRAVLRDGARRGRRDHDDAAAAARHARTSGARIGEELVDALVEVHAVDWQACGLEGYGKPTGYLERQLRRFTGLWEHNKTREIAALDDVTAWLGEHRPESGPATIVHGDYRLGNVMFAPATRRG